MSSVKSTKTMTRYTTVDSPLGELLLVGEESATAPGGTALSSLSVPDQRGGAAVRDGCARDDAAFAEIAAQLAAYFAGERSTFDIAFTATAGTAFQRAVWAALETVPYGQTVSYRDIAELAGRPGAFRAVGAAIGANPLLVVRPCHRVVGADGGLGGYAGGTDRKRRLLRLEGAQRA